VPTEALAGSMSREVEFLCPFCKARNKAQLCVRVDAVADPDLVDQLADGTLFEVTCWQCKESAPFDFSSQFLDRKRGICFWHDPPNDPLALGEEAAGDSFSDFQLRKVTDSNTFRELVHVWRDGLDDAAMLLLKHMLVARVMKDTGHCPVICNYDARINFEGQEWLEYVVFASEESDPETIRTPISVYESVAGAVQPFKESLFPVGQWVDWNDVTAEKLWTALQEK
jgi:hypothetical protein